MTLEMTERDKKLLAGLGFFCVVAIVVVLVILPLYMANGIMKEQIENNRIQIADMEQKEAELPMMRARNKEDRAVLEEAQAEMYPILKSQDIDRLLTEKVMSHGLSARKLQITMPQESANVAGYLADEGEGSNPDGEDGVWIATVSLETSGSMAAMDALIDDLALETPGVRITELRWSSARREVNQQTGLTERYDLLNLQLDVVMSRKD